MSEAFPIPGTREIAKVCAIPNSQDVIAQKEADIKEHIAAVKQAIGAATAPKGSCQDKFNERLNQLASDYKNTTSSSRFSRLIKATSTLEALDSFIEKVTRSIQCFALNSVVDHSATLKDVDDSLKSLKQGTKSLEERMLQNEAQVMSFQSTFSSIKELCGHASDALESVASFNWNEQLKKHHQRVWLRQ
ncbi:hypothetical protein FRC07_004532, partial [Ceratobasidium sp. 392]